MIELLYQWLDVFWIPVALLAVHKNQRVKTVVMIIACILTLRTQIEFAESFGFDTGVLNIMQSPLLFRGYIAYGAIIGLFLILAYFSPKTEKIVFFAAALSTYIFAFCISMLLMLL